jgi:hypothetical protein
MVGYKLSSGSPIVPMAAGDLLAIYRPHPTSDDNRLEFLINSSTLAQNLFTNGNLLVNTAIIAAGTDLLTVNVDAPVELFTFNAGAGAYTYDIDLDHTGAVAGNMFMINITKAASTNPTIVVRDGSGGSTIISINNGTAENIQCLFMYTGTAWVRLEAIVNSF